jgi:hypothetical protein
MVSQVWFQRRLKNTQPAAPVIMARAAKAQGMGWSVAQDWPNQRSGVPTED